MTNNYLNRALPQWKFDKCKNKNDISINSLNREWQKKKLESKKITDIGEDIWFLQPSTISLRKEAGNSQ